MDTPGKGAGAADLGKDLQDRAERIGSQLAELYPEPIVPLTHTNFFEFLCAVMMSAQSTDKKVNEVTPALFRHAGTPEEMAAADVGEVQAIIREVGRGINPHPGAQHPTGPECSPPPLRPAPSRRAGRPCPHQGQEPGGDGGSPGGAARRRGPPHLCGARGAARGGPQDRERAHVAGLWDPGLSCGHAHPPPRAALEARGGDGQREQSRGRDQGPVPPGAVACPPPPDHILRARALQGAAP
mmetsp:Transcript_25862/g.82291  ORF Transcript_25862/g.82291 Transcript_25862/m.82291 type:complete len:241 (-) Transcript_25862:1775-2497(-)